MPKASFRELQTRHLECRNLNHSWTHQQTTLEKGVCALTYRCSRCRTIRQDRRVRRTGELLGRMYVYADSYLIEELKSWGGRKQFNRNVAIELMDRYLAQKKGG